MNSSSIRKFLDLCIEESRTAKVCFTVGIVGILKGSRARKALSERFQEKMHEDS